MGLRRFVAGSLRLAARAFAALAGRLDAVDRAGDELASPGAAAPPRRPDGAPPEHWRTLRAAGPPDDWIRRVREAGLPLPAAGPPPRSVPADSPRRDERSIPATRSAGSGATPAPLPAPPHPGDRPDLHEPAPRVSRTARVPGESPEPRVRSSSGESRADDGPAFASRPEPRAYPPAQDVPRRAPKRVDEGAVRPSGVAPRRTPAALLFGVVTQWLRRRPRAQPSSGPSASPRPPARVSGAPPAAPPRHRSVQMDRGERLLFGGHAWGGRRRAPLDPEDLADVARFPASGAPAASPTPPAPPFPQERSPRAAVPERTGHPPNGAAARTARAVEWTDMSGPDHWPALPDEPQPDRDWSSFEQHVPDRERREVRREQARL